MNISPAAPKKAVTYIRFSSEGQKDGSSIERQTETITRWVERQNLELVETVIDESKSASKGHHLSHGKLGTELLPAIDAGKYRGFVFVAEALSVMLQVVFFKVTGGRRLFRMAPLHHHFEMMGWSETQVAQRFWLISMVSGLLGVALGLV